MPRSPCRLWAAAYSLSATVFLSLIGQTAHAIDFIAPQIEHKSPVDAATRGGDFLITATVTDDAAVASVVVHYREVGERDFSPLPMHSLDGSSHYEVLLERNELQTARLEYFFEATDTSGNTLEMYGSNGKPFALAVLQPETGLASNTLLSPLGGAKSAGSKPASTSVLPVKKLAKGKTWLWAGLGLLATAVVIGVVTGGDDPMVDTGDLDITTPVPVN
jgi:hypothetical protein